MKKIVAMLVAGLFSAGVFAQAAPAKKEEPKNLLGFFFVHNFQNILGLSL